MHVPFVDLKIQFSNIEADVVPIVTEAMQNGAFIGGPHVAGFEKEFASFCGSPICIGVGSGTDALRFALLAAGIQVGDEVITVPNTFIATTEAISQAGAVPVFVDIDAATSNIDVSQIEEKITSKTKAIMPVHLYGQPADMDPLMALAAQHGLVVIEDACQAHGALYKGQKAGGIAQAGCFSFYPGKNLGAFGEGGAVVTSDTDLATKIRMLRDHGQEEKYVHRMEGYNGRLDAIQAGVLRIKLKHLAAWNRARKRHAVLYKTLLTDVPGIKLPLQADYADSVWHLFVIHTEHRDRLRAYLSEQGIATGLHYPLPLHLQKAYQHLAYPAGAFPVTEQLAEQLLSLPMFPELTEAQIDYVCSTIKAFMRKSSTTTPKYYAAQRASQHKAEYNMNH